MKSVRVIPQIIAVLVFAVNAWEYYYPSAGQSQVWGTAPGWNFWSIGYAITTLVLAGSVAYTAKAVRRGTLVRLWPSRTAAVMAGGLLTLRGSAILLEYPDAQAAFMTHVGFGIVLASSWSWARTEGRLRDAALPSR